MRIHSASPSYRVGGVMCTTATKKLWTVGSWITLVAASAQWSQGAEIPAAADSFGVRSPSGSNFGADPIFVVKHSGSDTGNTNRKGIVRFALDSFSPGIGTPANDTTIATLRLDVGLFGGGTATTVTFNLFGILDGQAAESFVEGTGTQATPLLNVTGATPPNAVVYANMPGMDDTGDGVTNNTSVFANAGAPLAVFTVTKSDLDKPVYVSSAALASFLNADTNNVATFVLTRNKGTVDDNGLNTGFASIQHATLNEPTLFINQVVPEPTSLAIVAAGGLLLRRRRMRLIGKPAI
jgi:hypothetical protein